MTSNINSSNIDGEFPVAGVSNDTQVFRDNFTEIKNNFDDAKNEIDEIHIKGVFKSAISGTTLDNDFAGSQMRGAEIRNFSETVSDLGNLAGGQNINYEESHYQKFTTNGNITIGFINWPGSGTLGRLRLEMTVSNAAHSITLPAAVSLNTDTITGLSGSILSFTNTGTFTYDFTSEDGGSTFSMHDMSQNRDSIMHTPSTSLGTVGDTTGKMVWDATYLYVCQADHDGSTVIWKRIAFSSF